jgi:hypothetical protein
MIIFSFCAHAELVGKKKRGTDGNLWEVVLASNGVRRWQKITANTVKRATSPKGRTGVKSAIKKTTKKATKPVVKKASAIKRKKSPVRRA